MPRRKPPDALRHSNVSDDLNGQGLDACIGRGFATRPYRVRENIFQELMTHGCQGRKIFG